ncbi:MAG: biotin/lipoyl-binding protein [Acidiferrobacterales bacterium]|nr:biotin/lipoyl-binding protein [Acidiferrobacterales bacterium]
MFEKLLIANRGEIACRITQTARRLGIKIVAVHSDVDRNALHVALADEAVEIGSARPSESYLNAERIVETARQTGADAIHPGYGFLSENSLLAELCENQSIEFIGPSSKAIRVMASKSAAASIAIQAGVPVMTGYRDSDQRPDNMIEAARKIGFPVLLKSSAGGGGRGMRIVHSENQFAELLQSAKSEAKEAFDDDLIIIEKFLEFARHIEVQIAADQHGNLVHLFDRECSAQRRYQKIVEEAPAPDIPCEIRSDMYEAAIAMSRSLDYHNVGTVEYLLVGNRFYFMEMNTRLQVEHPVTEQITGVDLVEWQLRIAAGEDLSSFTAPDRPLGHAVEARLYAENPSKGFLPSPGNIRYLSMPAASDQIQIHSGVRQGDDVDRHYDPLIAKIVGYGQDRADAIDKLTAALNEVQIIGLDSNVEFLVNLLRHDTFRHGTIDVRFVENNLDELTPGAAKLPDAIAVLTALFLNASSGKAYRLPASEVTVDADSPWHLSNGWRLNSTRETTWNLEHDNQIVNVTIRVHNDALSADCGLGKITCRDAVIDEKLVCANLDGTDWCVNVVELDRSLVVFHNTVRYELAVTDRVSAPKAPATREGSLAAPLPGRVVRVLVKQGESVKSGQNLIVIEAMKMEHHISSPVAGIVSAVNFEENDQVDEGAVCLVVESAESSSTNSVEKL